MRNSLASNRTAWKPLKPVDFGTRNAEAIGDRLVISRQKRLSALEETPKTFRRGKHYIELKCMPSDWEAQLRAMRIRWLNYGRCDVSRCWVINFKSAEGAVAARLAYED